MTIEENNPGDSDNEESNAADSPVDIPIIEIPVAENESDLQAQLADAEKRALRYQADLDNYRRRAARDQSETLKYAAMPLVTSLLEVLDNLDRALQSAQQDQNVESLKSGVEMVAQQLMSTLEANGVQRIDSLGQPFDPNFHEAIQMQPSEDVPPNSVSMEVQVGYRMHDRVVRPSKVMVSTGPTNES